MSLAVAMDELLKSREHPNAAEEQRGTPCQSVLPATNEDCRDEECGRGEVHRVALSFRWQAEGERGHDRAEADVHPRQKSRLPLHKPPCHRRHYPSPTATSR